jgi:uncharacterized tellurite resistance protein B-like protein
MMARMEQRLAECLLVAKVLVADGIMTDDERTFLGATMARLGLNEEERRKVMDLEGWDEAEPIVKTLSAERKAEIVDMLMTAASADGRLSKLEAEAVKKISAALGL